MLKPSPKQGPPSQKSHKKSASTPSPQLPSLHNSNSIPTSTCPNKKHSSFLMGRSTFASQHSCHFSNPKQLNRKNRSQSVEQLKKKSQERQVMLKMERSINRFREKQNYFNKTLLQKKKQKKFYSIESYQSEQIDFFNSLARDSLLKQQPTQQQQITRQFPLKSLPSVCYDSQFVFQRQGSCLTILNNRLYLFGGAIRRRFFYPSLNECQNNVDMLFHSYQDDRWVREPVVNEISSDKKNLIHHTTNSLLKKYIVIVGGMMGDSQKTLSKFNEAIMIYNTQTKKMQEVPWNTCLRSHTSVAFDNYVILHGGVDQDGMARSEIHVISINGNGSGGGYGAAGVGVKIWKFETNLQRVHHQMVSTLGEEKSFKINLRENNGIYIFGGEDQKGKMNNQLKILKIYSPNELQKKAIKNFQTLRTTGQPPIPRKNHSLSLIPKKNSLVLIGGMDCHSNILSDAWFLDLCMHRWCRIETEPSLDIYFGGLCKHATVATGTSLYILGGRSLKGGGNGGLWEVDFGGESYERRAKERKYSQVSKISSCWSVGGKGGKFGTEDRIIFNE